MSFEGINYQRLHENVLSKGSIMLQVVLPNPTRFFGLNPILDPKFGLSRVGLALRVEKRVQSGRVGLK